MVEPRLSSLLLISRRIAPRIAPRLVVWVLVTAVFAGLALAGPGPAAAAGGLSGAALRGRQIYRQGTSPSGGEIIARVGGEGVEVPAEVLPCAGCHGRDGRGRPEGGVSPTDLTWESLSRPYGVRHASGREHPPYTPESLALSITAGVDPAGNPLHIAMPRYHLSDGDLADLVAYLRELSRDLDPGLGPDHLRLGTLLPPPGPAAPTGEILESVLGTFLADLDAEGGLYGRRLELVTLHLPTDPAARPEAVRTFLAEEQPFALVGAFLAGAEEGILRVLEEEEIPLVGPLTLYPREGFGAGRHTFYLLAGLAAQGRALVHFAGDLEELAGGRWAVLHPAEGDLARAAREVFEELEKAADGSPHPPVDLPCPEAGCDPEEVARRLGAEGIGALFFFDSGERAGALLAAAERRGWGGTFLAPGTLVGGAALGASASFAGRLYLAFPTLPEAASPEGLALYRRLAASGGLPRGGLPTQLAVLAGARVLVEGLKRAGRDLSRDGLLTALEGLESYDTGLTPFVTYGPNRRIGVRGAYIVTVDPASRTFHPLGEFREVDR